MPLPKPVVNFLYEMAKPEEGITLDIDKLITKWYGQFSSATLQAKNISKEFYKLIKDNNIPQEHLKLIDKYIENPEQYADMLSPQEIKVANWVSDIYDSLYNIAQKQGVLDAWIENYTPHIYKDKPEKIRKLLYPTGGRKFGTKFRFAKQRKIVTSDEAEKLGLHPIRDNGLKLQIYVQNLFRTIANKKLIDTFKEMKDKDGLPLIMRVDKMPSDYKIISDPAFYRYMYVGETDEKGMLVKVPVGANPEVAKVLNDISNPFTSYNDIMKGITKAQGLIKRLIMYNPLIHGFNIYSDVLDEMNFNFIKAAKTVFGHRTDIKMLKALNYKDVDELDLDMVKHGASSDAVLGATNELYEKLNKLEGTQASQILKPLVALRDLNDKILWQNMVLTAQRNVYLLKVQKLMQKYPNEDPDKLKNLAAHYTNDLLGTLPSIVFTKNEANISRFFLFARNWTVSNLRLWTGAMGKYGTSKMIPGLLRHKGLTAEEADRLAPLYWKHLIKGFIGLTVSVMMVNSAIKSVEQDKPTIWYPWEAEKGHFFDIDTGKRDKKGRKIYIRNPLFRYMGDYIGYGSAPLKTLYNKMEPLVKQGMEQFINYSVWQNKHITDEQGIKALRDRFIYFLRGTTPIGSIYGATQPSATGWEKIMPLTGTWARHGITPEIYLRYSYLPREERRMFEDTLSKPERRDFNYLLNKQRGRMKMTDEELNRASKFALKLIEFRDKMKTRWEDTDKKIDKLILSGKINEARKLMRSSGRYKTSRGIEDRIRRVTGGINRTSTWRWNP